MNRPRFPLGPLWVLIVGFWVLSLLEPLAGMHGVSGWRFPMGSTYLDWHETLMRFAGGILRGMALSQILLLAVWITLAKAGKWPRLPGAIGAGLISLFICLGVSGRAWMPRYLAPGMSDEWHPAMLTLAPFLLMVLAPLLGCLGPRHLGWEIAGPANYRPLAPRVSLWSSFIVGGLLLLLFGALLLFSTRFLAGIGEYLGGALETSLDRYPWVIVAMVVTPFTGLPWLALVFDAPRRLLWWLIAPSISAIMISASLLTSVRQTIDLSYLWLHLGHLVGILGTLGLLAACGWRFQSAHEEEAELEEGEEELEVQADDPPASSWWDTPLAWLRQNRMMLILIGVGLGSWLPAAWLLDTAIVEIIPAAVLFGLLISQVVLLAVWAVLSTAPPRIRVPGVALYFSAAFWLWIISVISSSSFPADAYSVFALTLMLGLLAIFMLVCLLLRLLGGFRIVRLEPPAGDLTEAPYDDDSQRGQQFSVRDLFIWTAGVAVLTTCSRWLLPPSEFEWEMIPQIALFFLTTGGILLPSLLCVGACLHMGRRWLWAVVCVVAVFPLTYLIVFVFTTTQQGTSPDWLLSQLWPFQISACLGVAGAMTLLATAGYRLEGRWARRQKVQAATKLTTAPEGPPA